MASFLVDDTGSVHLGRAGAHMAWDEARDDHLTAVREHGQVEWLVREGHVRIRLRPSLVSAAAHARLMAWLACSQPQRILLSWHASGEWHYEFLRNAALAGERVRALVERHRGAGILNLRRRACTLSAFASKPSSEALGFWRERRDTFQGQASMSVLGPLLNDRWVLYQSLPSGGFAVAGFGKHHTDHVGRWLARQDKTLHPDGHNFTSQACAPVYRGVADAFQPCADELDSISFWAGFGRVRSRYRRLMLPFRSGQCTWVVSGTCLDPSIDLLD